MEGDVCSSNKNQIKAAIAVRNAFSHNHLWVGFVLGFFFFPSFGMCNLKGIVNPFNKNEQLNERCQIKQGPGKIPLS